MSFERYLTDPVAWIQEVLRNPEDGRSFELYPAQATWLREALTLTAEGTLPYEELVFAAPKKSGKTATAAMALLYVICVLGGPYAEGYCVANDLEQAQGRVFQAVARIVKKSPVLAAKAKETASSVEFLSTGSTIQAIASDYAGAAGGNPTISVFDELWGYTSERSRRLWDELVPVPTRRVSVRLTTTYAGFEGESKLLEELYRRGLEGEEIADSLYAQPGLLAAWHTQRIAPWQTESWLERMRRQLRPTAFTRMIDNRFTSGESAFVPVEWWDRAAAEGAPFWSEPAMPVVLGVDAGLKKDSAAVTVCAWDEEQKTVWLVSHRIFYPPKGGVLDLEGTLEEAISDYAKRFAVRAIYYDPWQMARSAAELQKAGLPMKEFSQTPPNQTRMTQNLFELMKSDSLGAYPDAEIRLAVQRSVAVETSRGLRLAKEKASHKIDVVVALAMAALGAVEVLAREEQSQPQGVVMAAGATMRWDDANGRVVLTGGS